MTKDTPPGLAHLVTELQIAVATLRVQFAERSVAQHAALVIQAKEYERRLDLLNHAHDNLQKDRDSFLPRESYHLQHEALRMEVATVAGRVDLLRTTVDRYIAETQGRDRGFGLSWGLLVAIATLALSTGLLFHSVFGQMFGK